MKRPDYGDATPGDLARALMRPRHARRHERSVTSFVGGGTLSADSVSGQRESNGPARPSYDHSRTEVVTDRQR